MEIFKVRIKKIIPENAGELCPKTEKVCVMVQNSPPLPPSPVPSKKFFFALIKKIFLQTLVEVIFRYHTFFFRVLGPPGAPLRTK